MKGVTEMRFTEKVTFEWKYEVRNWDPKFIWISSEYQAQGPGLRGIPAYSVTTAYVYIF